MQYARDLNDEDFFSRYRKLFDRDLAQDDFPNPWTALREAWIKNKVTNLALEERLSGKVKL